MLCVDAFDLIVDLAAAFLELLDLAIDRFGTRDIKPLLTIDQTRHIRIGRGHLKKLVFEDYSARLVALGLKSTAPGHQFKQLTFDNVQLRPEFNRIKSDQDSAFFDAVAFINQDLFDHTAIGMLDDLAIAIDFNPPARDDRASNVRRDSPGAKPTDENQKRQSSEDQVSVGGEFFRGH